MHRRTLLRSSAVAVTFGSAGLVGATGATESQDSTDGFSMRSSAWANGETMPTRYTCEGENVSPPLTVSNPPEGTETFALVMDDPDAPNPPFVHWLAWNLPADVREIPASISTGETVSELGGAVQGANGTGTLGYVGPCPPEGDDQHTYLFSLYALEDSLDLEPGAGYRDLLSALFPVALDRTRYVGQYEREA